MRDGTYGAAAVERLATRLDTLQAPHERLPLLLALADAVSGIDAHRAAALAQEAAALAQSLADVPARAEALFVGGRCADLLLEHGRARMSENIAKQVGVAAIASYFNLGHASTGALQQAANLMVSLPYARKHETDADLVGIELAARAGFDPRAAIDVWHKMARLAEASGRGQPPQFVSTHPSHGSRIRDIEASLGKVLPLYAAARKAP